MTDNRPAPAPLACIILAAGMGTRMKSALPKVLHPVAAQPMLRHVLAACEALRPERIVVVTAPGATAVAAAVKPHEYVTQDQPLGTGHAVRAAAALLADFKGAVIVLNGDTPLLTTAALQSLRDRHAETGAGIVVGGFLPPEAGAYGRLVLKPDTSLDAIVEAAEATPAQRALTLCNSGHYLFDSAELWPLLARLRDDNSKQEFYLTDTIALARAAGLNCAVASIPVAAALGVNNRVELAAAERLMQQRLREQAMLNGATLIDPASVTFAADTQLGRDVVVGPHVVFGPGVTVADNVEIRAFCHLEQATVATGAVIGPYARLRPGTLVGQDSHIGNFVELKNTETGAGAKINHLSYIGDAFVGTKTNIGAGTITCNYDGFRKTRTRIGAGCFIGSNSALVAPVTIGDGAFVAAGSTVTLDVPPDALAVARARQETKPDWAHKFRDRQSR